MPSILLEGPAAEPVTLAEAKQHLRVEHDDDDDIIQALIAGSRIHVETQTRRALITQTWRLVARRLAGGRTGSRCCRCRSPNSSRRASTRRTARRRRSILRRSRSTRPRRPRGSALRAARLPVPERKVAGIEIDVTCGYGDAGEDVPEPLRQAIRLLVAHWYENRGVVAVDQAIAVLPQTVAALIAPYRVLSL